VNPKSIFISHNWKDKAFAKRLANDLKIRGVHVWIDEGEIQIGDSLIEKIREGIDQMDFLAVVLSPHSVESEWVKREVDVAMNQEIEGKRVKVLPLLYKDCKLPGFLKGKLYADFRADDDYQTALTLLLARLNIQPNGGQLFIFRKANNGKFLYVNEAFVKAFGKNLVDIVGKSDEDFFSSKIARTYRATDKEVMKARSARAYFELQKDAKGDNLVVHVIKHPIFDTAGNVTGVEGIYWIPTQKDED